MKTKEAKTPLTLLAITAVCISLAPMSPLSLGADDEQSEVKQLRKELDELKAEMANMKRQQNSDKAEIHKRIDQENRALIQEVLDDAGRRSSLEGNGILAGHNGKHFFLKSEDNKFLMNIGGQLQFRFLVDHQEDRLPDETESGIQFRRAKITFWGHAISENLEYKIAFEGSRTNGRAGLEQAFIAYTLENGIKITAGMVKVPFLREELTSDKRQLAVDRSSVTEFFTMNRADLIEVSYTADAWKGAVAVHDGGNSGFSDIGGDFVEVAVAGRLDLKLAGDWSQIKDFTTWEKDEGPAVFLGAAFDYELGDGDNGVDANYFGWTVDASLEAYPFNIFGALMGGHIDDDGEFGGVEPDMLGVLVQAGVKLSDDLEFFARYEMIDPDFVDKMQLATVGINKYYKGHEAKLTLDVVVIYEGMPPGGDLVNPFFEAGPGGTNAFSSGLGFTGPGNTDDDINVLLRLQFQLLF